MSFVLITLNQNYFLHFFQEALEVCKPHFISRSQERLKKLEHMVKMRKAQQGDSSGKKQGAALSCKLSSSSIASKKKQYTVPHPLSGEFTCGTTLGPSQDLKRWVVYHILMLALCGNYPVQERKGEIFHYCQTYTDVIQWLVTKNKHT